MLPRRAVVSSQLALAALASLGACAAAPTAHELVAWDDGRAGLAGESEASRMQAPGRAAPQAADADPTGEPAATRKRVYVGDFKVLAPQRDQAIARFLAETERLQGYVENRTDGVVVVRVPAESFDALVKIVPALGRVLSESVRTQDVTSEWTDLNVRIQNAEAARQRLVALLDRAVEMKDVLAIEEQLRRLTTEIEQMRAQLKLLDSRIAYAKVTVDFQGQAPPPVKRPAGSRFRWVDHVGIEPMLRRF